MVSTQWLACNLDNPRVRVVQCDTDCAFGARSAHTWFALKLLPGFPRVRSYDGSWNEWSRLDEEEEDATS